MLKRKTSFLKTIANCLWLITLLFGLANSLKAQGVVVEGTIYDDFTKKPVTFAVLVVPEAKISRRIAGNGYYAIELPNPGVYTFNVSSPGLKPISQKITVTANLRQDFYLPLAVVKGQTIIVKTSKEVQKVSRNTLDIKQIKDAPATLGDSLGALATLPGVIRSGGFFGPLIIRGAPEVGNRYFIDDIPVLNPQHFGGLQSVISNDLIKEIDLYSSAFPAQFGGAYGAIIDITTIDDVSQLGGVVDVGLISSNFLLKNRWGEAVNGKVSVEGSQETPQATGYWITAARLGYLSLLVPPLIRLATGQKDLQLPEYYDYQLKGKLFFDDLGKHSLTVLAFGSYDTFRFLRDNLTEEEKEKRRREGADPLGAEFTFRNNISSHSQGVYYQYKPSTRLENRLIAYNALNYSYFYIDVLDKPPGLDNSFDLRSQPHVFGLKDKLILNWWDDMAQLRTAVEYNLYYFSAQGHTQTLTTARSSTGQPDIGDPNLFRRVEVDFAGQNHTVGSYLENRFKFGGLEITPGVRADYLLRGNYLTAAPRGLVSYEFETKTTLAFASGLYYSFPQTNQFLFNRPFNQQIQVVVADYLRPEAAQHNSVSLEQVWNLFSIKLEGFWNDFYSQLRPIDPASNNGRSFDNSGKGRTRGVEIFLRKDQLDIADSQLFGWASYTYTVSEVYEFGRWRRFEFEQPHSIKLIGGYRWGRNQLGARFEFFSGFPYTAIIGSQCTPGFACAGGPRTDNRYSQIFDSQNPYGKRFPFSHRLDLRYTRNINYSWGSFRWYLEVINVYNYVPINQQRWNYNQPYQPGVNPKVQRNENALSFIPNFGLEWRF